MTMKQLLMGRANCPCGMNHVCPMRYVEITENAFEILPELTLQFEHILVVADRNTYAVVGELVTKKDRRSHGVALDLRARWCARTR